MPIRICIGRARPRREPDGCHHVLVVQGRSGRTGRSPVLGLDVGGVIIDRASEDSDTSFFGDRPMETPAVSDAVEVLRLSVR